MSTFNYPQLTPSIAVQNASAAIEFYTLVFGASERFRLVDSSSGQIVHAEIQFGDSLLMLCEEMPEWNKTPQTLGGTTLRLSLHVANADDTMARAIAAGATETMAVRDQFYGFRSGNMRDPFGHEWMIQHSVEEVSPEDMQKRWDAMCLDGSDCGE
ncbi:MAG: VOC family protein [Verrucomicrobia bacterium]|nr:VOC family protein [Verrucomicrobiota bacterium]